MRVSLRAADGMVVDRCRGAFDSGPRREDVAGCAVAV